MSRTLFLLALGIAAGYSIGFRDARAHRDTIVERVLDRAGGSTRGKYNPDIDAEMERESRPTPAR